MRHLPSIEALTDADDRRLRAELEICQVLEKLERMRALVDRADHLLTTVLACGAGADGDRPDPTTQARLYAAILEGLRR